MTPADIAASRTILAAATQGTWITVQPRSQEGAETLASFGPAVADDFPAATQIRLAGSGDFGDIAARQARMPWEQHAANCKAAAHAVNTLPVALDALEEIERRIAAAEAALLTALAAIVISTKTAGGERERAAVAHRDVLRILRGKP